MTQPTIRATIDRHEERVSSVLTTGSWLERQGAIDDPLLVRLRLALQLPQYRPSMLQPATIERETERIVTRVHNDQWFYQRWKEGYAQELDLSDCSVAPVENDTAQTVHSRFHYIGTTRQSQYRFGLYPNSVADVTGFPPALLITLSKFDLDQFSGVLPEDVSGDQILVLSRSYAFRWAPQNAFTYTFSRVASLIREYASKVKLLLTYINPNVGFTGSTYRAANWQLVARENVWYKYLDGNYVTDRQLRRQFGTANYDVLREFLGQRITRSQMELQPLHLYGFALDASLERNSPRDAPVIDRW